MDAVKFLKEKSRMCNHMTHCSDCPLNDLSEEYGCDDCENFEEMVDFVETWSEENPVFTNGDKFTEIFGVSAQTLLSIYHHELSEWCKEEYYKK